MIFGEISIFGQTSIFGQSSIFGQISIFEIWIFEQILIFEKFAFLTKFQFVVNYFQLFPKELFGDDMNSSFIDFDDLDDMLETYEKHARWLLEFSEKYPGKYSDSNPERISKLMNNLFKKK